MGLYTIKLPDVGEGVAEAELVEWAVAVGDLVKEDQVLAAVMTDKATVEIPSPVAGKILWLGGEIGETLTVGSEIIRIEVQGEGNTAGDKKAPAKEAPAPAPAPAPEPQPAPSPAPAPAPPGRAASGPAVAPARARGFGPIRPEGEKPLAPPSVRRRARESGVDLRQVPGSDPAGRITHEDLDAFFQQDAKGGPPGRGKLPDSSVKEVPVIGLRRRIAERMALAKQRIPHITIVEEIDVTALEETRAQLNNAKAGSRSRLTLLPFLMCSLVRAAADQPHLNAHFDDDAGIVRQFGGVHIGIATQTPNGLIVPVVRHCEALDIWEAAAELARLAEAARNGTAKREELSGSTITITSLGPLGALATTPIINRPEVAIVGVNRMAVRPHWDGHQFVPRKMMNLSCSFDHRVIDGWDAAVFVQRLKSLLETPATIFVEG